MSDTPLDLVVTDEDPTASRYELPKGRPPPGPWAEIGLCAHHPVPDLWFPGRGESTAEAKAICRVCPVRAECLEHAVRNGEKFGIWGGRSERERRRLRRSARTTSRGAA